ncbi:hypothetical protein D3C83_06880 [compost metagenome]
MGAADLHDLRECFRLPVKRVAQPPDRGLEVALERGHRRDVHRGGKGVVGGLPLVDIVVGMHPPPFPAAAAEQLGGAVRQHLVDVHVGLGAGPGLPHHQREMVVEPAGERLVRRPDDGIALLPVERTQRHVDGRGGFLDEHLRAHDLDRHGLAGKMEVMEAPLRLRPPQPVGGHRDSPHRVTLNPRPALHGAPPWK